MPAQRQTPCEVLFSMLKSECGMTNFDTASMVLSTRATFDGRSPVQRASEKTWLLRYVVHADAGCINPELFAELSVSVPRLVARMKGKRSLRRAPLANADIVRLVVDEHGPAMARALAVHGRGETPFSNALARIAANDFVGESEKAEQAMALMVSAAVSANGAAAVEELERFNKTINVPSSPTPPRTAPLSRIASTERPDKGESLGLVRLKDGLLCGTIVWLHPDGEGALVSSLRSEDPEGRATVINDVAPDVSAMHARIRFDKEAGWTVVDLGSRNGTVVKRPVQPEVVVVEPPQDDESFFRALGDSEEEGPGRSRPSQPVSIHPGDVIIFGGDTAFCVLAHPSLDDGIA